MEQECTLQRIANAGEAPIDELCAVLEDAVRGGASVGFLAPLTRERSRAYWQGVAAQLGPALQLWVARAGPRVVGTVQLAPCLKENGRHRAELQKLQVLREFRGRGIASRLMEAAEARARELGISLLVLDTLAGSEAEPVYSHLGWHRVGEVPDYAGTPQGELRPTAYYYKRLA